MDYLDRLIELLSKYPNEYIARKIGVHVNTVGHWMRGETDMHLCNFVQLVRRFKLDANYIINGEMRGKPHGIEKR